LPFLRHRKPTDAWFLIGDIPECDIPRVPVEVSDARVVKKLIRIEISTS
jgi:hypothetical protein